jgi:CRP/FNR family transcriptional regulator
MRSIQETDCGDCRASDVCWQERVSPGTGIVARRVKPLAGGERLVDQGARFEAPFVVTGGCVAVTELLDDGGERIVAFRVPGELVGVESWHGDAHRYSAQAVGSATVCRLRWSASGLAGLPNALVRKLLVKVSAQLDHATRSSPGRSAAERVRGFVDDFAARSTQELPMTRAQIGRHLGIAEETVVRAFARLPNR